MKYASLIGVVCGLALLGSMHAAHADWEEGALTLTDDAYYTSGNPDGWSFFPGGDWDGYTISAYAGVGAATGSSGSASESATFQQEFDWIGTGTPTSSTTISPTQYSGVTGNVDSTSTARAVINCTDGIRA